MISFVLNAETVTTNSPGGMPVLDWIRNRHGLTGTKEGCREGDCGACTVVLGKYSPEGVKYSGVCSCLLPLAAVHRCHLVTIEGLSRGGELTPFQQAFYDKGASQCGFCTPGMIMSLTGFLLGERELTFENAIESLDGNICRCTGYAAVRRAVLSVLNSLPRPGESRLEMLMEEHHVPEYFRKVPALLQKIDERKPVPGETHTAGGTDLYVHPTGGMLSGEPDFISAPDHISAEDGLVRVGAGATVESIRNSGIFRELFPGIDGFFQRISSTQIRSRATLGGNIMNGSPIADLAVLFLALRAVVYTDSKAVPLNELYLGYKKFAVDPGEILQELSFAIPHPGSVLSALKVCKREHLDIASVNSAALVRMDNGVIAEASLSAGGVFPYPLFLEKTSDFLKGRRLNEETVKQAEGCAAAEIAPISDIRGSKEYKTELLRSQIRAHLTRSVTV